MTDGQLADLRDARRQVRLSYEAAVLRAHVLRQAVRKIDAEIRDAEGNG